MTLAEREPDDAAAVDAAAVGGAGELLLRLDGFAGSLDLLLDLARTHRVDLRTLDLLAVIDQLIQATRSETGMPLSRRAAWTVTASWLLLLRSALLLPRADPRRSAAAGRIRRLQAQLLSLQQARALARWLDARPQLGWDVFARGGAQAGPPARAEPGTGDRIEFLWACVALFEGDWSKPALAPACLHVPPPADVYSVEEARARVGRHMADATPAARVPLADLLPQQEIDRPPASREEPATRTLHRSAWSSTLTACLELAKQGDLTAAQEENAALPIFNSV